MKLFSLLKSGRYRPTWTYTGSGQLWRILFSHGSHIAGESRDHEKKRVRFFCLDRMSGTEQWCIDRRGEGWWTTTECIFGDHVYLHAFAQPDLPNPKHVTAVDLRTGSVVWYHPDFTFLYVKDNTVVVENRTFRRTEYYRLLSDTGQKLETIDDPAIIDAERLAARAKDPHLTLRFPEIFNPNDGDHGIFRPYIESLRGRENIADPVEVSSAGNNMVFCYHVIKRGRANDAGPLSHELSIVSMTDNSELYHDVILDKASAQIPDGFMMKDSMLFYIRDKSDLVAVTLQDNP